jgi:cysteine-rich repeat protein
MTPMTSATKSGWWLAAAAALIFVDAACTRSLDTAPCPCLHGWYCCPIENVCALQGTSCEAETVCGNGVIEAGETCDDGPVNGRVGRCTADCKSNGQCGNGVKDPGEECDYCADYDGGIGGCWLAAGSPMCNGDCTLSRCGDSKVNFAAGEECDDPLILDSRYCNGADNPPDIACHFTACGDGHVNGAAGETCDPLGGADTPTCNGAAAPHAAQCRASVCGDGYVNFAAGEACDDGNTVSGDGCSPSCQVETGFICAMPGSPCRQM